MTNYSVIVPGPECPEAEAIEQLAELRDYLLASEKFSFDCETEGIDPRIHRVFCYSFSTQAGEGIVVPLLGQYIEAQGMPPEFLVGVLGVADRTPSRLWSDDGLDTVIGILTEILESDTPKTAQNGVFDVQFSDDQLGIRVRRFTYDTMLACHLFQERRPHNLEHMRETYLGKRMPQYDQDLKLYAPTKRHCFSAVPNEILWTYAAGDADCEFQLGDVTLDHIRRENPKAEWILNEVTMPLQRALAYGQRWGIPIDREYAAKLAGQFEEELAATRLRLNRLLEAQGIIPLKNYNSAVKVRELVYASADAQGHRVGLGLRAGRGVRSTDAKTLTGLYKRCRPGGKAEAILNELLLYKQLLYNRGIVAGKKAWTRFVTDDYSGRGIVHPKFHIVGTEAARLSSASPNVQNLPRSPVIRNIIRAWEEHDLIDGDYSQVENRVEAYGARCETYVRAMQTCSCGQYFADGLDLEMHLAATPTHKRPDMHGEAATKIWKGEVITKERRDQAKTFVHGVNFGRGAQAVSEAFHIPKDAAQTLIDNYFKDYPEIKEYHQFVRRLLNRTQTAVSFFGRRRTFPLWNTLRRAEEESGRRNPQIGHIWREAINMFPQASAAEVLNLATDGLGDWEGAEEYANELLIHRLLKEHFGEYPSLILRHEWDAYIALSVHDSLVIVSPKRYSADCAKLMRDVMIQVPRLVVPLIESPVYGAWPEGWYLPAEVQIKERWGKDEELNITDIERDWLSNPDPVAAQKDGWHQASKETRPR